MANIKKDKFYRIFKSCGDNDERLVLAYETSPGSGQFQDHDAKLGADAGVHHFLVEPFIFYITKEAAEKRAKQLSKETPGNRYYVMESVSGFISRKPKTYKRSYR